MAKKPQIRFQGHQDEWENKKLGETTDRLDNQRIPVAANLRIHGTTPYYGANGIQDYVEGHTHSGENVLIAEDGANDVNNYPIQYVEGDIWVNNHAHVLCGKQGVIDNKFLAFALKRIDFSKILVGTTRAKLTAESLVNIDFIAPRNDEQQKIGDFFAALDELIGAKEEELEKLRQLKQALLQQMFPANTDDNLAGGGNSQITSLLQGSNLTISNAPNTPRIRFKGFTEPWEKVAIKERLKFGKGRGYSKNDLCDNGEPIILYGVMYTDYITNITRVSRYAKLKDNSLLSRGNEVIVPASGETAEDIARASAVLCKNVVLGGDLNVLYPDDKIAPSFLALELTYGQSHSKLVKKAQGISVVHLHNSDIEDLIILVPSKKEQQMIGDFFREQDEQINAAQQQIKKLTIIKQALLQKMFAA